MPTPKKRSTKPSHEATENRLFAGREMKDLKPTPTHVEYGGHPVNAGDDTEIIHVAKMGRDALVVALSEYKGKRGVDLRRYYLAPEDVWRPSGQGIRIPTEALREVVSAIVDRCFNE